MTKAELAAAVYSRANVSRAEAFGLVDMMLDELSAALSRSENVKLSSFGAFSVRSKKERIGRNPKTGAEAVIAARRVVTFKASRTLRDRLATNGTAETALTAETVSEAV